jgi:exonuclease V gamma subunit
MQNQQETDGKIIQLVQTMAEVYTFAKNTNSLSAAKQHLEDTVTTIVQQTGKCAMFVREYTGHGFLGR